MVVIDAEWPNNPHMVVNTDKTVTVIYTEDDYKKVWNITHR